MQETFTTEEDVLRYIYRETSPEEDQQIQAAIAGNLALNTFYRETLETLAHMDSVLLMPNPTVLDIINEASEPSAAPQA